MSELLQYIIDNTDNTRIKKLPCGSYEIVMNRGDETLVESMPCLDDAIGYSYRFLKNEIGRGR